MTPEELADIHATCFTSPRPWSAAEFAGLMASDTVFLITEPQGFLLGRSVADESEVLTLAVLPAARGMGIGTRLLELFKIGALAQGSARAFLEVAADNAPALALYRNAGFTQSGLRKAYYTRPDGTRTDAVILSLELC